MIIKTLLKTAMVGALGASALTSPATAKSNVEDQLRAKCGDIYKAIYLADESAYATFSPEFLGKLTQDLGKGTFQQLGKLGAVKTLGVSDTRHLSNADVFVCDFKHESGRSKWTVAFSPLFQNLSHYEVAMQADVVKTTPVPTTSTSSAASNSTETPTRSSQKPDTPTQSEACRKFPDLC